MLMAAPSAPRPRPRCCRAVHAVCANRASARIVMGGGQASLRRLQSFTSLCTLLCRLRLVAHVAHVAHVTYSLAHVAHVAHVTYSPPACHSVRLPLWSCASLTLWSCVPLTHSSCVLALLSCLFHARAQARPISDQPGLICVLHLHIASCTLHLHIASCERRPISDLHLVACGSGAAAADAPPHAHVPSLAVWGSASTLPPAAADTGGGLQSLLAVNCYDNILRVYERLSCVHGSMPAGSMVPASASGHTTLPPVASGASQAHSQGHSHSSQDPAWGGVAGVGGEAGAGSNSLGSSQSMAQSHSSMAEWPERLNDTPHFHLQVFVLLQELLHVLLRVLLPVSVAPLM